MTTYIHGRPERAVRRRRRSAIVLTVVLLAATLVGLHLADATDAASAQSPTAAPVLDEDPALAGVDDELARRFTAAQAAAADDGVVLTLTSGRRTAKEQRALVEAAEKKYGSKAEAHRWVLPARSSAHVKGLALDVGPTSGALWLGEHGLAYGLCRTYANEVWHFEKLPGDRDECAPMHPDSSSGW
ncbi:D-alanyl-D-alanine carboxypeptidase family protein [Cellulomonas sp. PhB150]|uniref:D-alanyl-D-alanine carboxypeptidase family protein n=1 Tax=Cellulomonas sp. PhB150 TaxID=2485188 RepID=UPI0011CDD93C|nr:D-alanyl-D-alanine carboxypeptidase family protein [Cellulomonas sp. PhB150]